MSHAVPFSSDEQQILWSSGVLSDYNPKGLQIILASISVLEVGQNNAHPALFILISPIVLHTLNMVQRTDQVDWSR